MGYIDALIAAVPKRSRELYTEHAQRVAAILREHGALGVTGCWGGDDTEGETRSFAGVVQCRADETPVLAWIMWPSRAARDAGLAAALADPRLIAEREAMGLDSRRLIHGAFEVAVGGPGVVALTA